MGIRGSKSKSVDITTPGTEVAPASPLDAKAAVNGGAELTGSGEHHDEKLENGDQPSLQLQEDSTTNTVAATVVQETVTADETNVTLESVTKVEENDVKEIKENGETSHNVAHDALEAEEQVVVAPPTVGVAPIANEEKLDNDVGEPATKSDDESRPKTEEGQEAAPTTSEEDKKKVKEDSKKEKKEKRAKQKEEERRQKEEEKKLREEEKRKKDEERKEKEKDKKKESGGKKRSLSFLLKKKKKEEVAAEETPAVAEAKEEKSDTAQEYTTKYSDVIKDLRHRMTVKAETNEQAAGAEASANIVVEEATPNETSPEHVQVQAESVPAPVVEVQKDAPEQVAEVTTTVVATPAPLESAPSPPPPVTCTVEAPEPVAVAAPKQEEVKEAVKESVPEPVHVPEPVEEKVVAAPPPPLPEVPPPQQIEVVETKVVEVEEEKSEEIIPPPPPSPPKIEEVRVPSPPPSPPAPIIEKELEESLQHSQNEEQQQSTVDDIIAPPLIIADEPVTQENETSNEIVEDGEEEAMIIPPPILPVDPETNENEKQPKSIIENDKLSESFPVQLVWGHGGKTVGVQGSFNDWKDTIELIERDGQFATELNLSIGEHHFKYLVDGDWTVDNDQAVVELDGHGQVNVTVVKGEASEE